MKIKMLQPVLGAVDGHWSPRKDDVLEVSSAAGGHLCAKGFAEPVVEDRAEKRPAAAKRTEKRKG